ncbi:MAG: hypothetical protein H6618_01575 [Deltaproteobacteria bacterium]|nr:hypothetical protein [Deltaproteobacteria bacterium]
MGDQWLSIIEYARQYNLSDMTVRRRIKAGKLHAVLKEGKYFIPATEKPAHYQNHPLERQRETREEFSRQPHGSPRPSYDYEPREQRRTEYPQSRYQTPNQSPGATPFHREPPRTSYVSGAPDRNAVTRPDARATHYPQNHREQSRQHGDGAQDRYRLISACEAMLKKLGDTEKSIRELAETKESLLNEKIGKLEEQLNGRDASIRDLEQKIEDMQTLIRMLNTEPEETQNRNKPLSP